MENLKSLTYDIDWDTLPPEPGQYIVSIGKRGIGQVYLVVDLHSVKQKVHRPFHRLSIKVKPKPELKPYTVYEMTESSANVWVRGDEARPLFWYPRNKKK